MNRTGHARRGLRMLLSWMLLGLSIAIAPAARAQAVPYAATFTRSREEVEKALKEMQAYAGQKLPIVDGFVATGDQPLDRFERAFYQFSIDVLPGASGGTTVRVLAKITAWYADPEPWKSSYQVLPSNGRLELDLLDRLKEKFGSKLNPSDARSQLQAPRPKLDLRDGLSGSSLPLRGPSVSASTSSTGAASGAPATDEVNGLRTNREAEEKHIQQLNGELQNLQEIKHNQAHPLNLVVVKENGSPVLARPVAGSHPLFKAAANDEFEFLDAEGEWIHVQISGVSRGYIRRRSVDLPDSIAARLKSPNDAVAAEAAAAKLELFRIEREETSTFPGDWETLRGKPVKIYTVQAVSQDEKGTNASAKLDFAATIFQKFSAELATSAPRATGVVIIFDSADGGIVAATSEDIKRMVTGSLSRNDLWKQCYFDPPDTFERSRNP